MPTFEFTSPDGKKYQVDGPEGATKEQAFGILQGQLKQPNYATQEDELLAKRIYNAGGAVTDFASKIGASPEVSGGLGYGANVAMQALPTMFGPGLGKAVAPPLEGAGKWFMGSALKPTLEQWKGGDADIAIKTLLEKGINPTREGMFFQGGVNNLKKNIGVLDDQIQGALAGSNATVNKYDVASRLNDTMGRFTKQVNPQSDLNAVENAWSGFLSHPQLSGKTDIPVQLAQDLKQGTYKQLYGKYGELKSADIEAQKGLARGLRETIAEKVPTVAPLLSDQSNLIKTLDVAERRAMMDINKNPAGLALLTQSPGAFAAFIADKSALFKSILGRMFYSSPDMLGRGALAGDEANQMHGILSTP